MFSEGSPIFQQLAAQIANDIVAGTYPEGTAVPSASEYAIFYQMNPATAGKAVNVLVEQGVLFKKRGVGMFVSEGARELLSAQRHAAFRALFVEPLVREAHVLGIETEELARMIAAETESQTQNQDPSQSQTPHRNPTIEKEALS
ncbi:GntR family transcriptional regulator [Cryobacterium sp. 10C2]|uniref:GntR family transcriptional regulator n=2 Tax=unclassified Cryobacterium TaxID=2649013 RepID=UPI002AB5C996|nr:GntR family transcriptional regulator [Cryobacterium sp. 10C2]MDY7526557.1 GntR family transcriptional regulator [Cryobacterium sp. 10C2]MEB0290523.1 GntR family transcriptional regulator [Cryobacterium sp. 10C2]